MKKTTALEYPYYYCWGNNPWRAAHRKRLFKVIAYGKMGSICIEFKNGTRTITDRRAMRKVKPYEKYKKPDETLTALSDRLQQDVWTNGGIE